jgi:hypothetical protein
MVFGFLTCSEFFMEVSFLKCIHNANPITEVITCAIVIDQMMPYKPKKIFPRILVEKAMQECYTSIASYVL